MVENDNSMIMGKNSVRIVHALGIKHLCNFGPIVPTVSIIECMKIVMTNYRLT